MSTVTYPHLEFDHSGRALISGKRVRVTELVLDRFAYHWDVEDIQRQHPHLTLAEIHSAFAYYYDHQEALDQQIAQGLAEVDQLQAQTQDLALQEKLRLQRKST